MANTLHFACNDPDNGNFAHGFAMMEVDGGDLHMEFENSSFRKVPVHFDFALERGPGKVKVGRLEVEALSYKSWYGNWCWDAVSVSLVNALTVINYVGKLKGWRMTDGPCSLFEAFNDRHCITPQEWKTENEFKPNETVDPISIRKAGR